MDEEDDGNPYDSYTSPTIGLSKPPEEEKPVKESENKKLLGDALEDLAGDESPPSQEKQGKRVSSTSQSCGEGNKHSPKLGPAEDTPEPPSQEKQEDKIQEDPTPVSSTSLSSGNKHSPKLKPGVWPPPVEDAREPHPESSPPLKSAQPTVLKKWKPKEWKKEDKQPPPSKMDLNSWAKSVQHVEVKKSEALKEIQALKKPTPAVKVKAEEPAPPPVEAKPEEKDVIEKVSTNKFVALKPLKKDVGAPRQQESKPEVASINLKKTTDKQVRVVYQLCYNASRMHVCIQHIYYD